MAIRIRSPCPRTHASNARYPARVVEKLADTDSTDRTAGGIPRASWRSCAFQGRSSRIDERGDVDFLVGVDTSEDWLTRLRAPFGVRDDGHVVLRSVRMGGERHRAPPDRRTRQ